MALKVGDPVRLGALGPTGVVMKLQGQAAIVIFHDGPKRIGLQDLMAAGSDPESVGDPERHLVRAMAQVVSHAYRFDESASLSSARVEPYPHQVFAAHRVISSSAPRMILADEVGLGKTIEAGLVIKALRVRLVRPGASWSSSLPACRSSGSPSLRSNSVSDSRSSTGRRCESGQRLPRMPGSPGTASSARTTPHPPVGTSMMLLQPTGT